MDPVYGLVLWLAYALIDGEPRAHAFPDEATCQAGVQSARAARIAVSDCVKVTLPAPKLATL